MTDADDALEERLARLAVATRGLRPSPGFEQRVNVALLEQAHMWPSAGGAAWLGSVVRPGRWVLAAAAAAAIAAVGVAVQIHNWFNHEAAVGYAALEVEW